MAIKIKSYKNFSIAHKLIWFIIPLIFLTIIILSSIAISTSRETLKATITANLENTADLKVSKIQDFYKTVHENTEMLQKMDVLGNYIPYLNENISAGNDSLKAWAKHKLQTPLRDFIATYNYHCIKLLNTEGKIIMATQKVRLGDVLHDPKGIATQKGKTGVYFSDIFESAGMYIMAVTAPIIQDNKLVAIVAIEINMQPIYELIQNSTGLGKTGETLIAKKTQKGALFLNPLRHDPSAALRREALKGSPAAKPILEAVHGNQSFGISKDYRKKEVLAVWRFIPEFNWGLVAKIDTEEAFAPVEKMKQSLIIAAIIAMLLAVIILLRFAKYLSKPLINLENTISVLGSGNLVKNKLKKEGEDEIGKMIDSTNALASFQSDIIQFAKNIGEGKFDTNTDVDSAKGVLGESLTNMSISLQKVAEADKKRNWSTIGLAKFADILRANDSSMEDLSDTIVSNLIKYMNANQGSMFVANDNKRKPALELTASYAWERKKFQEKNIQKGEGLVGRCWQEAATIFLTEVPKNYINITSGLGEANPSCILIVPVKIEDAVYGVIELASFNVFEQHEIEFAEQLAESIASTISNAKVNLRTASLLEESKGMTEQLQAQEEEMRQNMEEMQATQEEMDRANLEMKKQMEDMEEVQEEGERSQLKNLAQKEAYEKEIKALKEKIETLKKEG